MKLLHFKVLKYQNDQVLAFPRMELDADPKTASKAIPLQIKLATALQCIKLTVWIVHLKKYQEKK